MIPGGFGHGLSHCEYCSATDREIAFALGPNCPNAPDPTEALPLELDLDQKQSLIAQLSQLSDEDRASILQHFGKTPAE